MKNKYQNTILIFAIAIISFFAGIAFVNNWLVLQKKYPKIGLYDIPFDSNVWGTVSDWAMVVITIFTAYFLVKTFIEQKNINKSSVLPIFKIDPVQTFDPSRRVHYINITLIKNSAYNLAPSRLYSWYNNNAMSFPMKLYIAETDSFEIVTSGTVPPPREPLIETIATYSFRDLVGNVYFQDITYNKSEQKFNLSLPRQK